MSSSLTAKVTSGSAERPDHLPPMYAWQFHLKADGLTPEISTGPNARSRVWANLYIHFIHERYVESEGLFKGESGELPR